VEWIQTQRSYPQAPEGVHKLCKAFPSLKLVTSEVNAGLNEDWRVVPGVGEFGNRYFGTDDDPPQFTISTPTDATDPTNNAGLAL
jgi:uridine kinase